MSMATRPEARLTRRQRQALAAAAAGLSSAETAASWNTSVPIVKQQLASARRRLGARTTTHAVAIAINCGYLEGPR